MSLVQEFWATEKYQKNILYAVIVLSIFSISYMFMSLINNIDILYLSAFIFHLFWAGYFCVMYYGIRKKPVLAITESSLVIGSQFGYGKVIPLDSIVSFKEENFRNKPHAIYVKQKGFLKGSRINRKCLSINDQEKVLEFLLEITKYP